MELPAIEKISESQQDDPFQVLIATLLSARTQDATTLAASTRLFARARTPRTLAALPLQEIERLIYPVSFYRNKARHVKAACQRLLAAYGGRVPSSLEAARDPARRRTEDRHAGDDPGVPEPSARLRGHARAPHLEPTRLGADDDAGADRAGALRRHRRTVVAVSQPVPGHLGSKYLPPGVPSVWRLCHRGRLPPPRRHQGRPLEKRSVLMFTRLPPGSR